MQTQCPECQTLFEINKQDQTAAAGRVQCGHCYWVFDINNENENFQLIEELDTSDIDINTFADAIDEIPKEEPLASHEKNNSTLFEQNPMIDDLVPADIRHQEASTSNPLMTASWSILFIIFSLTAALQLIYFNRDQLANNPELRPYMQQFCEVAKCQIADLRDVQRIELSSKNVYSHPNVDKALMITAVIVNQAAFTQRFPVLQISFTNLVGDIVIARQFKPGEYLNTDEDKLNEMQPGLPIQITLEVLDPGNNASAYEFHFI